MSSSKAPSKAPSMKSGLDNSTSSEVTGSDIGAYVNVEALGSNHENSTAAVLNYCKSKVLSPYFRLLSMLGWRPLMSPSSIPFYNFCVRAINFTYTVLILTLIMSGYFLQYCTCYRGDGLPHLPLINLKSDKFHEARHPSNEVTFIPTTTTTTTMMESTISPESTLPSIDYGLNASSLNVRLIVRREPVVVLPTTCNNKIVSHFIIPDVLHFLGYLYVFYLLRTPECERLENLMERGFLQTSRTTGWFLENRRLVNTLRSFLLMSLIWVLVSVSLHLAHFNLARVCFPCLPIALDQHWHRALVYVTIASITCFDIICSAVITSYAVHCQLNISYIHNLCRSIREKRITFQEFYQRAEESRRFVDYLNSDQAIGVSLLLVVFICKVCLYVYELIARSNDSLGYAMILMGFFLWAFLLVIPLTQGLRLTSACAELKQIGHELKSRPFGYQDIDESELNSLLLYTASLNMEAKLFHIPIRYSSVILVFTIILIGVPLLGQINVISL